MVKPFDTSASLTMLKPLCGSQQKILKDMGHLPPSYKNCMPVKKQQLELDGEQWTGSKLREEHIKAVCCHPAYLTFMQSIS